MSSITTSIKTIEKEAVNTLNFPSGDVLSTPKERNERMQRLEMAQMYGDTAYYKVKICFEDSEGLKNVHTTVWDVKDNAVHLKEGVTIPIERISEVVFP